MSEPKWGGMEFRDDFFHFHEAFYRVTKDGRLCVGAGGKDCELGIQTPRLEGVAELSRLPGRSWEVEYNPRDEDSRGLDDHWLYLGGKKFILHAARVECRRFDSQTEILAVSFTLKARGGESWPEENVEGMAYCRAWEYDGDDFEIWMWQAW